MKITRGGLYTLIAVALASLIAVWQPFGYSPDYSSYEYFFSKFTPNDEEFISASRFEPGFIFISSLISKLISEPIYIYGLLVCFSIYLKLHFLRFFTKGNYYLMVIAFYVFKFFPLHELTQLRATLSTSFIVAVFYFIEVKFYKKALICSLIALTLHYSSAIVLLFLWLSILNLSLIANVSLGCLIFGSLFLLPSNVSQILGQWIPVFHTYVETGADKISAAKAAFSPVFYPEFYLIAVSLVFWRNLTEVMKKIVVMQIFGFILFYGLIDFAVVAVRSRELFSVLWIFYVAQLPYVSSRMRLVIEIFVVASIILSLYVYGTVDFFSADPQWINE